jgi:disulfide bond formation protein DsbB
MSCKSHRSKGCHSHITVLPSHVPLAKNGKIVGFMQKTLGELAPFAALLVSWVATGGSLYMSEVLFWPPCPLCWAQRAFMYPLALILAIGVYMRWQKLPKLVLPMCLVGGSIAFYHYMEVMNVFPPAPCNVFSTVPCEVDLLMISLRSSWLAVPLLALTAFILIGIGMLTLQKSRVWAMSDDWEEN